MSSSETIASDRTWTLASSQAHASLVLGCLSFGCSFLTGIPAILIGLYSLRKIRRSNGVIVGQGHAIGGILTGSLGILTSLTLLLVAVAWIPEASARIKSDNNLRNIGLGLHDYHDQFLVFPRPVKYSDQGKPLYSWRVSIDPYIE
jgi:hypothetical protein